MYIVNASKFIKLDAKKLSKMGSDSVDQSNDASLSSTPDGPATIWIKNLSMADSDDEVEPERAVIDFIVQHPQHFFIIEEKDAALVQQRSRTTLPSNVFSCYVARSNDTSQIQQSDDKLRCLVIENPEGFNDFKAMENFNWVIINIVNAEKYNIKNISIALLVKHCNNRSIPVSIYPANTALGPLDAAIRETDSGQNDPLYFELPITDDHTLMIITDGITEKVSNTNVGLQHWLLDLNIATMVVSFYLFKLRMMARHAGQKSFWSTYFGVKTAEEFTRQIMEISRSQMYRYLQAIEVIELLFPEMMEKIIAGKMDVPKKVLSYSRWYAVFPFRFDIDKDTTGIKEQAKRMLLDPAITAKELGEYLNKEYPNLWLAKKSKKRPEPFDIIGTLKMFNMSIMGQLAEGKRIHLFQHLKAILWLYISDLKVVDEAKNVDRDFEKWGKSLESDLEEALGLAG